MTIFPYTALPNAPYQFNPTLDGQQYTAVVPWELFGRRLYLSLFDVNSTLVVTRALVGSVGALAVQSASWAGGTVTLTFANRHGFKTLTTLNLTVTAFLPDVFNGIFQAFVTDRNTVTYSLASDPGPVTRLGAASYDINLVEGYIATSTMVFREMARQFEVTP